MNAQRFLSRYKHSTGNGAVLAAMDAFRMIETPSAADVHRVAIFLARSLSTKVKMRPQASTVDAEGHSPFKDVKNFIFRMEVHRRCCAWRRDIFHNCIAAIHL